MSSFSKSFFIVAALLPISSYAVVFDLEVSVPDISSTAITTNYDPSTNLLVANGLPGNLVLTRNPDGSVASDLTIISISQQDFLLQVNIDSTTGEIFQVGNSYGTVSISGRLDADNNGTPLDENFQIVEPYEVLLTGEITAFDGGQISDGQGGLVSSSILEFLFTPTGGTLVGDYTSSSDYLDNGSGIVLGASGFAGDWTSSWGNNVATADTSVLSSFTVVPEPSSFSFLLGALSLAFVAVSKRRLPHSLSQD